MTLQESCIVHCVPNLRSDREVELSNSSSRKTFRDASHALEEAEQGGCYARGENRCQRTGITGLEGFTSSGQVLDLDANYVFHQRLGHTYPCQVNTSE